MIIRNANIDDNKQLLDIYNYEVMSGTATFDLQPKTLEERLDWLTSHNIGNHPLLVAELDGMIAGYACLSPYCEKEAFCATVELSVYIHQKYRRQGIAKKLMTEILRIARVSHEIHTIISVITETNEGSIHLHEEFGFICCGTLREVGYKFGCYLNVINYQLMV